ncbi:endonuclease domain-containing protein [Paenibacillus illinoisensis]|uniref:Restriction endonuclease n=1 Tax=Paenibacillus illinoisensis TaxID=59845 RepID=A0A2W0CCF3_9BACL|nr:hypothetical protein [Paenibacillus illinoisensis]PYY28369.1 Restriction endonuclease [Paenibacillus illinoisensis]
MKLECKQCHKKIEKSNWEVNKNINNFCSHKCHGEWNSENKVRENHPRFNPYKVNCGHCQKEFNVPKYKYKNLQEGKVKNLFCTKSCLQNWQSCNFKKKQKTKTCEHCKGNYISKNKSSKYCSLQCIADSKKVLIRIQCDNCNVDISRKPSGVKDSNFCSVSCRSQWNSNKSNKVIKECVICKNTYTVSNNRLKSSICCSLPCLNLWKSRIYPKTEKGKASLREKGLKTTLLAKHQDTKPERMVREYLEKKGISYVAQNMMYDKFIVDFYLKEKDIVIEVLGDYWHGNPLKYGDSDNLIPLTPKQLRQKAKDKSRYSYLSTCGHKVLMIWEKDIYDNINEALSEVI